MKHGNVVRQPGPNNDWTKFIDYGAHDIKPAFLKLSEITEKSDRHYQGWYCTFCNQILKNWPRSL